MVTKTIEIRIYTDGNGQIHITAEYRSDVSYGANVKVLAFSQYSEGGDNLELSGEIFYSFCRKLSDATQGSIHHLERYLLNQNMVAINSIPVIINEEQNCIRNLRLVNTVLYRVQKN